MELTQLIVLAVLHSLSEVWPIGAQANATFFANFLNYDPAGDSLRLCIRIGLLLGVMAYFVRDLADMVTAVGRAAQGKRNPDAALALQIAVAAIPTLGLGFATTVYAPQD